MNKVTLIGNLVRDIELKNYKSEDGIGSYTQFTLALNEYNYKSRENVATFISVVSFGKQAEILAKYAVKGRKMCIEGKLNNSSYINSKGEKKHGLRIILENFQFLDSKKERVS